MDSEIKDLDENNNDKKIIKVLKIDINKIILIFIILSIILLISSGIIFVIYIRNKSRYNDIYIADLSKIKLNFNEAYKIFNNINCSFIQDKFNHRVKPFEFEEELLFILNLIQCKIPFSLIRFGDGENAIMRGESFGSKKDKWHWNSNNKKFQKSLIESLNICNSYNGFIGIPCHEISKSILSFSNCSSSKYISYSTLFINKNFELFKYWIFGFINSKNRWKIILASNSNININIEWAYQFIPIPDNIVENWSNYNQQLLTKLSELAKYNNLIFFISAGPAANIIISYLTKVNNKNIYLDLGSSIEFITKGYSTRSYYNKNSKTSKLRCESFILKNKTLIYE